MEFNIGDEVKVINKGNCYTTYDRFMEMYGTKKNCMNFKIGELVNNGFIGKISAIAPHISDNEKTLAIVDDGIHSYIMGVTGLELIKSETNIKEKYSALKKKSIIIPLYSYAEDSDTFLIELKNEQDFDTLKEYFNLMNGNYSANYLNDYTNLTFPCTKLVYDTNSFTDFCFSSDKFSDTEILIDGLSKAITDINNF